MRGFTASSHMYFFGGAGASWRRLGQSKCIKSPAGKSGPESNLILKATSGTRGLLNHELSGNIFGPE